MKTSSAKAKGRKLQDWVKKKLIEYLDEDHTHDLNEEITTAIMGEHGADVKLSNACGLLSLTRLTKISAIQVW